MIFTDVFTQVADAAGRTARYVSSCGGTRSGKTFSMLQFLYILATQDTTPTITSVVSETLPHLRKGAIRDFKAILGENWREEYWNKSETTYTLPSGAVLEFFSADSPAKVHGPARDRLLINEAQNIDYDTARQLFVRTRDFVFIDYNPTRSFWVNEKIEPLPECIRIHSTYLDNRDRATGQSLLTPAQIREIENNRRDENWWRVYGLGQVGQLEGLVYSFTMIDALPSPSGLAEVYGLDFGYTNDPTACVHILADTGRKILYVDQVIYERGLLNSAIIERLQAANVSRFVEIYADAAEPKSVDEIHYAGFNARPCYKGRAVVEQIQYLQGWEIRVTKGSLELINELRNYTWAKDKDGHLLNVPVDLFNHALDALRYGVFTKFATFKRQNGGRPKTGAAW